MKRLQNEQTRKNNQLSALVDMLSDARITKEEYDAKREQYQGELGSINLELSNTQKKNFNFHDEASTILSLLKGIKAAYLKQDFKGKAQILKVVLDRFYLKGERGKDSYAVWKPPFDILFQIAEFARNNQERVRKQSKWGE